MPPCDIHVTCTCGDSAGRSERLSPRTALPYTLWGDVISTRGSHAYVLKNLFYSHAEVTGTSCGATFCITRKSRDFVWSYILCHAEVTRVPCRGTFLCHAEVMLFSLRKNKSLRHVEVTPVPCMGTFSVSRGSHAGAVGRYMWSRGSHAGLCHVQLWHRKRTCTATRECHAFQS